MQMFNTDVECIPMFLSFLDIDSPIFDSTF